jgi:hypothetical protein
MTSVQSTAGSRDVCISGSNAGYTVFRGSIKSTGYPLHSPLSPSLPCVTVCHHISTGLYQEYFLGCKGGRCVWLQPYHLHVPIALKSWSLTVLEPSGTVQNSNGIALENALLYVEKRWTSVFDFASYLARRRRLQILKFMVTRTS